MNIDVIIDFVIVVVSIIMLWKGADWLVDSAAEIAHLFTVFDHSTAGMLREPGTPVIPNH